MNKCVELALMDQRQVLLLSPTVTAPTYLLATLRKVLPKIE